MKTIKATTANLWVALTCLFSINVSAADLCTPELIRELRTNYTFTDKATVSEVTRQIACSDDKRNTNVGYEGFSFGNEEVRKACVDNNRTFFQRNAKALSLSFLPVEAIEKLAPLCNSEPNNLTLDIQGSQGDLIELKARWFAPGTGVRSVTISSFSIHGPANCPGNGPIRPGQRISEGGVSMVCNRTGDGKVVAVVNTTNGVTKFTAASRTSIPTFDLALLGVDDHMTCTLNGAPVAGLHYGQPAIVVNLNPSLKPGANKLSCTVTDERPGSQGQACWAYSFNVRKNGVAIAAPQFSCCTSSDVCNKRSAVIDLSIDYPVQ